jgi:hypothetical protein
MKRVLNTIKILWQEWWEENGDALTGILAVLVLLGLFL